MLVKVDFLLTCRLLIKLNGFVSSQAWDTYPFEYASPSY